MRLAALLLLAALLAPTPPATAAPRATTDVSVVDDAFTPATVTVALGDTVTWAFNGQHTHTVTSDQGFFDSGDRLHGQTFSRTFTASGGFAYHCMHHSGMHGKVVVRMQATGTSTAGWTLRWATQAAPDGLAYDVQFRREGTTTWRDFRKDTAKPTGFFNPTASAKWFIRARTTNTTAGSESGWSPQLSKRTT